MDSDLKFATFKQGKDKFPLAISGNFASVYQATTRQGQHKAVRCFQRPPINLAERYEQISMYLSTLSTNKPSSLVEFKYIENGIRVKRARFYPIVKMDWVEGDPLNIFVKKHLRDKKILLDLINKFLVAVKQLRDPILLMGTSNMVISRLRLDLSLSLLITMACIFLTSKVNLVMKKDTQIINILFGMPLNSMKIWIIFLK